jgi:hypothetical protein
MSNRGVYVIGGGPSLRKFNFRSLHGKYTIAINKSIFYVRNPTYFITMDYTFLKKINLREFKDIKTNKYFVGNFSIPELKIINNVITDTRFNLKYLGVNEMFNKVIYSKSVSGIGQSYRDFRNGENSGYCGLQLALLLGFKEIYLLGFDLNFDTNTHFHAGYKQNSERFNINLKKYFRNFKIGLREINQKFSGVKIYNCSENSLLNKFLLYHDMRDIR